MRKSIEVLYRVLVCGGRTFGRGPGEEVFMQRTLDSLHLWKRIDLLVTGGAFGVDSVATWWARSRGVQSVVVPANWNGNGRAAGMQRNQLMLDLVEPHLVVAFPGGRGTAGMVMLARKEGIDVRQVALPVPEQR